MLKHCTQCGESQEGDARFCAKCGAAIVAVATDPMIGKVVADRYLLLDRIGQGGSGTIYRAEHTTLRKKCAVKILHHQLSQDETAIERFRREATTVGEIDNEHILQVLDFGRAEDKRLFFAMEYLEGETLTKVIERDGKLSIDRVFNILTQVAEALMEAHGLGYIHRDLRPRNIFLTTKKGKGDFVKLLDFGLAKLIVPNVEAKQTALGMTFGDPRYMSPEQARGETVDRRADIYSLGVIAFEMLAGTPPYSGSGTFEVLQKHLDSPIPSVRVARPDCPEWLDLTVQRALAKRADERFVTVFKMLECLRDRHAPQGLDESDREAHAKLTATAQIKAVGDLFAASGPPKAAEAPKAPEPKASEPKAPAPAAAPAYVAHEGAQTMQMPQLVMPNQTATAGEVHSSAPARPQRDNVPSVVVESGSADKTVRERVPASSAFGEEGPTIPIQKIDPPPPLPPPPENRARKKDPTGEQWFSESGKFDKIARAPGATLVDDEEDYEPKKNHSGLIIGGVIGGLTLVGLTVILLLPKPAHKPLRGEVPEEKPPVAATVPPPAPEPAVTPPAPAAIPTPAPVPVPTVAVAPAPVAPAPAPPAPTPEKPAVVAAPRAPVPAPVVVAPKPEPPAPKPVVVAPRPEPPAPKPVAVAPKPAPVAPRPEKPLKPEKGTKVASADSHHGKLPEGFRDPFAAGSGEKKAESAQADFYVKLGRQKLNASDLNGAAANFNKAREFDAKSPDAFAGLGEVAFEQGDYNAAKINLMQALRLSPNRARYLVLLGQTYYKLGRAKEAVAEYRKALRLDPNNAEAQHSLEVAERKLAQQGG